MLCHMGICPEQIMTSDNIQESEIRIKWKEVFENLKKNFSFPIKMAVFPATYQNPKNMHHLIIDGMLCECTVEEKKKHPEKYKNSFTPDDLGENVDKTGSCVVTEKQAFFKFMD